MSICNHLLVFLLIFFPGWSPHTGQLLYLHTSSHLLLSIRGHCSSPFPSFSSIVQFSFSNRSFPFAYTIAINSPIGFSILTLFLAQLHFFTTKLLKWVVSISFLPLSLEQSPIRLLANHSRETALIQVTNDLHFLNPMVKSQASTYLTYLQNLALLLQHIFLRFLFFLLCFFPAIPLTAPSQPTLLFLLFSLIP